MSLMIEVGKLEHQLRQQTEPNQIKPNQAFNYDSDSEGSILGDNQMNTANLNYGLSELRVNWTIQKERLGYVCMVRWRKYESTR